MKEEDIEVQKHLKNVLCNVEDKHDKINNVVWGIEDTQNTWND